MKLVDLSLPIRNFSFESQSAYAVPLSITMLDHRDNVRARAKKYSLRPEDFPVKTEPTGTMDSITVVTASAHSGTHMDAPYHFGPLVEGKPAKRIDDVPLEWCFSDGVVLNFTHKKPHELIGAEEVQAELQRIEYTLKPLDIVLIHTGASKHWDEPDFMQLQPGMSRGATLWLISQGIKLMGIDAWGFDAPMAKRVADYKAGKVEAFWECHYAGREREYCHMEKLNNLDLLPPYGFRVAAFPIKIHRGDAGWCRVVAILDQG